jgi:carboxyl-terminal processing protease
MKKIFLTAFVLCFTVSLFGQLKNPGFETKDASSGLPSDWNVRLVNGFTATLVNDVKHNGDYAVKISSADNTPGFLNITQAIDIDVKELKKLKYTAYIKTENLKTSAVLWCQIWNDKKMIGFESFQTQGISVNGTTDWKKYTVSLVLEPTVKRLVFGAFAMGGGNAWFDDFAFEEFTDTDGLASEEVLKYSNEFNAIVKKNSIYTDSLNWPAIEANLKVIGKGLKTIDEAKLLTNYVLQQLRKAGDNHSFIQDKVAAQKYAATNTAPDTVRAKLLPNGIGYISIPAFGSTNQEVGEQFAQNIQNWIKKLETENNINGWVVDMRGNGGGNMYPMIAGLKPLIGKGTLGYFVKGKDKNEWNSYVKVPNPYVLKNEDNNIAILIGPRTGSSGEMSTIAFIGKKNTKLFGEPSGGYITANSMHFLSDGAKLLLASSYSADRNGKKYIDRIYPDVTIKAEAGKDAVVEKAVEWLLEKK